jgi:hypothetical protein
VVDWVGFILNLKLFWEILMKIINTRVLPPSWGSLQTKEATHMKAHLKFLYSALPGVI